MLVYKRYLLYVFCSICTICTVSVLAESKAKPRAKLKAGPKVISTTQLPIQVAASPREERLEDEYLLHYKDTDQKMHRQWTDMRKMWFGNDTEGMKQFCEETNKLAGRGSLILDRLIVQFNMNFLRFRGKNNRESARVDILRYSENETSVVSSEVLVAESDPIYLTMGLRPECVYLLEPTDQTNLEFFLEKHVCKKNTSETSSANTTVGTSVTAAVTAESSTSTTQTLTTISMSTTQMLTTTSTSTSTPTDAAVNVTLTSTSEAEKATKKSKVSKSKKSSTASKSQKSPKSRKSTNSSKASKSRKSKKSSKVSKSRKKSPKKTKKSSSSEPDSDSSTDDASDR